MITENEPQVVDLMDMKDSWKSNINGLSVRAKRANEQSTYDELHDERISAYKELHVIEAMIDLVKFKNNLGTTVSTETAEALRNLILGI